MSNRLAAYGVSQIAVSAATGWLLALAIDKPHLLDRAGIVAPRRLNQCHVDLLMMGGLITAAAAVCDPPRWAATAVSVGGVTNPVLFLPLAFDPGAANRPSYKIASVASFGVTCAGWFGLARAVHQQCKR